MPDLNDLRAVLDELEADAVSGRVRAEADRTPAAVPLASMRQVRARRRAVVGALVAAAAVAALAVGVAALSEGGKGAHPAPPADHHRSAVPMPARTSGLHVSFTVDPVAGLTIAPGGWVTPRYDEVGVSIDGLENTTDQAVAPGGEIFLFRPGVFDASHVPHLRKVDVNGHPGWVTRIGEPLGDRIMGTSPGEAVVWEYAPGAWGEVHVDASGYRAVGLDANTKNLELARAVRLTPQTLSVPFRIGYLPEGLTATDVEVGTYRAVDGERRVTGFVTFSRGGRPALTLEIERGLNPPSLACPPPSCHVDDGAAIFEEHGRTSKVEVEPGGTTLTLSLPGGRESVGVAQLRRILRELTLAPDVTDESTWFDAAVALP